MGDVLEHVNAMIGVCIGPAASALATVFISTTSFTLSWTGEGGYPPVEADYRLDGDRLALIESRVKDDGVAKQSPDEATLVEGWWRMRGGMPDEAQLRFTLSAAKDAYSICWVGQCWLVSSLIAAPAGTEIVVRACDGIGQP
jgi:hypothetical protein